MLFWYRLVALVAIYSVVVFSSLGSAARLDRNIPDLALSSRDVLQADPGPKPSAFPASKVPELANQSLLIIPNCNKTKCNTPGLIPAKLPHRKRAIDQSYNSNFRGEEIQAMYERDDNRWYVRTRNQRTNREELHVYLVPLAQTPSINADQYPTPVVPVDFWATEHILPPWLLREFATVNRMNDQVGNDRDLQSLEWEMSGGVSPWTAPTVPQPGFVTLFVNSNNQFGADERMLTLRMDGMAQSPDFDLAAQELRADALQALADLEAELDLRWYSALERLVRYLPGVYPNSPSIGVQFRVYANCVRSLYRSRLQLYIDATAGASNDGNSDTSSVPEDIRVELEPEWETGDAIVRAVTFGLGGRQ